ncbi:hypothetical protein T01_10508 [Trichinella spiralis]|uniref:Uncharacterized protein n=1 Tax=Trichinella spiralis TaxID=6334 RepID=A0A0V1BKU4_TRISP|nr:hypothetical protein T01_10508 [Trichinella spiralis]
MHKSFDNAGRATAIALKLAERIAIIHNHLRYSEREPDHHSVNGKPTVHGAVDDHAKSFRYLLFTNKQALVMFMAVVFSATFLNIYHHLFLLRCFILVFLICD